jgi:hypothetical protein
MENFEMPRIWAETGFLATNSKVIDGEENA